MEKEIYIRECKPEDYKAICRINRNALNYDYPEAKTKERLELILRTGSNRIFAAFMGEEMLGYIHGCDYECLYQDSFKNIMAFAVDTDYQGNGIGRKLLTYLEVWAASEGSAGVRLVSGMNRTGAHEFYEHCGYFLRKEQKNFMKVF